MTRIIQLMAGLCCVWGLAGMSWGAEPGVVFLHGGRDSALPDGARNNQGLLARELMRQALLCAARDELGCATYDLQLGQPAPAGATHLDIVAVRGVDRTDAPKTELEILSGEPPRQELLVASTFIPKPGADLVELLRLFEARSRGSFIKNLEAAGISGKPRPWNKNVPAEDTLKALAEMSFVSQFRAACELHAQIEEGGRSPALVAALSRAYANLAVLTELHWAPAHKVFAARALLYAQRLVAGKHDNTNALGSRAYAYALVGLHQAALDDLDALDKLATEKKAKPGELHRILRSYCTFDIDKLDPQACEPRHAELVRLLRLLAREQSGGTRQTIEEAMLVSKAMPHCYRAQDSVGLRAGVSLGHVVTVQGIVLTTQTLYRQLSAFPDLPKDLKATISDSQPKAKGAKEAPITAEEFPRRAKLITAFQRNEMPVGKQRQLTWSVLGHLMAEHSFLEVYRRARFEGRMLAAAPDQFLDVVKPLYEWHRFAAVADFLRKNSFEAEQTLTRAGQIDLDTIELQSGDLVQVVPKEMDAAAQRRKDEANFLAINHMDHTASDLLRRYPYWANERAKEEAEKAYTISPHSPAVRAHLVTHHWKKVEPQLEQWLRDAAGDASEQAAIGLHYQREKEWDKAIEFLQRARDLSPELVNIRLLAEAYRSQGKTEEWQATLEELLKQPDYGLEHAKVRVEIADHYIGRHEYSKALPFALQAAGTYAEWGLLEAAQCYEALQKWDEAEDMYRAASQGYQNFQWFLFTRRTGHGNVEEAKQLARQSLAGNGRSKITPLTLYYILRALDDREGSRSQLEEMYAKGSDPVAGVHLAMLADERKDFARRDAVLAELLAAGTAKAGGGPRLGLIALVEAFVNDLAAGGKAAFDPQVLLEARIGAPQGDVAAFEYLLGKYLQLHGNPRAAEKIWLERMSRNIMSHYNRTLCGMELRALGVGPEAYKEKLQKPLAANQPSDSPPK